MELFFLFPAAGQFPSLRPLRLRLLKNQRDYSTIGLTICIFGGISCFDVLVAGKICRPNTKTPKAAHQKFEGE